MSQFLDDVGIKVLLLDSSFNVVELAQLTTRFKFDQVFADWKARSGNI